MKSKRNRATQPLGPALVLKLNAAIAEHKAGMLEHAESLYRKVLAKAPGQPDCLHWLGVIAGVKGSHEEAARLIGEALSASPNLAGAHANLANALIRLDRFEEAVPHCRRALEARPDSLEAALALMKCLYRAGDMPGFLETCQQTAARAPNNVHVVLQLGAAYQAFGQWEEATTCFRRVLTLQPKSAEALRRLVQVDRRSEGNTPEILQLTALAEKPDLPIADRATIEFSLAKALDDANLFDEAFGHCVKANALFKQERAAAGERFDLPSLRNVVDEAIAKFAPDFFKMTAGWGDASELPVFIVGMPRSGTSLVEQIAASHSQVFGAGELRYLISVAKKLRPAPGSDWSRDEVLSEAKAHLGRLRVLGKNALRIVDKMPDNLFILGVIATFLPGARVIFCRRDPRDIVLSCFFQRFNDGNLFAYDLADCGRRYLETERLAKHWHSVLPLRMLDVQYETLVADLEGESRRLIAFLGLEWEPACLEFHRNTRPVRTLSAWQVRQPLYDRSVGRWRNYRRQLQPLLDVLTEGGMEFPAEGEASS